MKFGIILAGGVGSRLWPLSRELYPKQLISLIKDEFSLIQETLLRLTDVVDRFIIVTNKRYEEEIKYQIKSLKLQEDKLGIIGEPYGKSTAPAAALASIYINNPEDLMFIVPSDHLIREERIFKENVLNAFKVAKEKHLVVFGIEPDFPSTGYGYIKPEQKMKEFDFDVWKVERFIEKPKKGIAEKFLKDGGYFWNSGMFVWRKDVFLEELKEFLPDIYEAIKNIEEGGNIEEEYKRIKPISIDYGIMEKSKRVAMITSSIGWSDLGSWDSVFDVLEKDKNKNFVKGNTIVIDSNKSLIYSEKNLVAALGVENLYIISTEDATLICKKGESQKVKDVVRILKDMGKEEYLIHKTLYRPWGKFTYLEKAPSYVIKEIEILPGKGLKKQIHHHRSEHWIILSGTAKIEIGDKTMFLHPNQSVYVPPSTPHKISNPGKIDLKLIEVEIGEFISEEDVELVNE